MRGDGKIVIAGSSEELLKKEVTYTGHLGQWGSAGIIPLA